MPTDHFYAQFYAGICAALAVVDVWDHRHQARGDSVFEAILQQVPDLDELLKASERRGEYELTGRIRRYKMVHADAR